MAQGGGKFVDWVKLGCPVFSNEEDFDEQRARLQAEIEQEMPDMSFTDDDDYCLSEDEVESAKAGSKENINPNISGREVAREKWSDVNDMAHQSDSSGSTGEVIMMPQRRLENLKKLCEETMDVCTKTEEVNAFLRSQEQQCQARIEELEKQLNDERHCFKLKLDAWEANNTHLCHELSLLQEENRKLKKELESVKMSEEYSEKCNQEETEVPPKLVKAFETIFSEKKSLAAKLFEKDRQLNKLIKKVEDLKKKNAVNNMPVTCQCVHTAKEKTTYDIENIIQPLQKEVEEAKAERKSLREEQKLMRNYVDSLTKDVFSKLNTFTEQLKMLSGNKDSSTHLGVESTDRSRSKQEFPGNVNILPVQGYHGSCKDSCMHVLPGASTSTKNNYSEPFQNFRHPRPSPFVFSQPVNTQFKATNSKLDFAAPIGKGLFNAAPLFHSQSESSSASSTLNLKPDHVIPSKVVRSCSSPLICPQASSSTGTSSQADCQASAQKTSHISSSPVAHPQTGTASTNKAHYQTPGSKPGYICSLPSSHPQAGVASTSKAEYHPAGSKTGCIRSSPSSHPQAGIASTSKAEYQPAGSKTGSIHSSSSTHPQAGTASITKTEYQPTGSKTGYIRSSSSHPQTGTASTSKAAGSKTGCIRSSSSHPQTGTLISAVAPGKTHHQVPVPKIKQVQHCPPKPVCSSVPMPPPVDKVGLQKMVSKGREHMLVKQKISERK